VREQPSWRPLSDIDIITDIATQSLAFAREHLDTISPARPYTLDDHTVARILRVWRDAGESNRIFAEQAIRWRIQSSEQPDYIDAVTRFGSIVEQERTLIEEILDIAQRLESMTIERLQTKSDFEVGLGAI